MSRAFMPLPAHKLVGAKLPRDLVQHRIYHARLLSLDKGVRDIDIFRHHDAARHVLAVLEFVTARAKYRTEDGVDPLQPPAPRQRIVDERVEFGLTAPHPRHDVAEEGRFTGQIFVAFALAPEPMAL